MGRKAYPKIRLTEEEVDVVEKLARVSKIDVWFGGINEFTIERDGYIDFYDKVYDRERGYCVSIQYGIRLLDEGLSEYDLSQLNSHEKNTWNNLKKTLGIG